MEKQLFLLASIVLLSGCTQQSNTTVNPCDAIMHTWDYTYYSSDSLKLHFCYQDSEFSKISFEESGNKLIFNYQNTYDTGSSQASLEILNKDPSVSLSMYLSSKFVGSTCTQSCSKDITGIETCHIFAPNNDFMDQTGLVPYHGTCPAQYLANQHYRSFIVLPKHPDKIIFNDQVGGDLGPIGILESLNFN